MGSKKITEFFSADTMVVDENLDGDGSDSCAETLPDMETETSGLLLRILHGFIALTGVQILQL